MRTGIGIRLAMTAATAALAAGGATGLAQQEPRKVAFATPDRWEAGEVFTVTDRQAMDMEMTQRPPGAEPVTKTEKRRAESVVVWRCLEVDGKGTPKRAHAWVKSFEGVGKTGRNDTCASGAFVEATPGKWTLLSPEVKWSGEAQKWFEKKLRLGDRSSGMPFDELGLPEALAVGETLRIPGGKLMKALGGDAAPPVDVSKLEMTFRLDSAEDGPRGTVARMTIGLAGPLLGPLTGPPGRPSITVGEGSAVKGGGRGRMVVGGSHRDHEMALDMEMTILLSAEGMDASAVAKIRAETLHVPGGEMPEVPKSAPVPPTAKAPPAPAPPAAPPTPK